MKKLRCRLNHYFTKMSDIEEVVTHDKSGREYRVLVCKNCGEVAYTYKRNEVTFIE